MSRILVIDEDAAIHELYSPNLTEESALEAQLRCLAYAMLCMTLYSTVGVRLFTGKPRI